MIQLNKQYLYFQGDKRECCFDMELSMWIKKPFVLCVVIKCEIFNFFKLFTKLGCYMKMFMNFLL
jgi:hypothetical protein